jgi:uncharacterized protein (TIGR03437 family)
MSSRYLLALLLLAAPTQAQLFQPAGTIPLGQSAYYAIADFNLDGRPDLIKASAANGTLTLYLGAADGGFLSPQLAPISIDTPTAVLQGDYDGDGKPDVVVLSASLFSEPSARIYVGNGAGAFTAKPTLLLPDLVRAAAVGDFDSDGNLDLAIVTATQAGTSTLSALRGNGSGNLAIPNLVSPVVLPVPAGSVIGDMQPVDLNGDGKLDLVMTVMNANGIGLAVAMGDGRGLFSATATIGSQPPLSAPPPRLAIADFNGDQRPDVVTLGYVHDSVTMWFNSGGVLVPQTSSSINMGSNPYDIAAADFDLDGRMDWAVARQLPTGTPQLFVGLGNGAGQVTFAQGSPFPYGGPTPYLEVGDFNGDRRQDLLIEQGSPELFQALLNIVARPPTLLPQEITFPQPSDRGLSDGNLTLTATASSGLPVTFAGVTNPVCTVSKGVVTLVTVGTCTVFAIQLGDTRYSPAPYVQRSFTITKNTQSITFAALVDRTIDLSPFTVTATASSGLPVTFTASPANVCTVTGTQVILLAVGQCSITASQAGNATFPPATPVTRTFAVTPVVILGPSVDSIANAASYALGTLSPASYGALFGTRLTGATLKLRDATGAVTNLELTFSGPAQINFIVPANVAKGAATVIVTTPTGAAEFPVTIAAITPGLFSANGTGQGLAAAQALIVNNDKTVTVLTVGDGPIPVRGGTEIYLVLYGTGIRGRAQNNVLVTIAGTPVEVLYAGPQGFFPALDQINVRVPLTVGGFGNVDIRLTVDGIPANVVTATFQ